jgi:hypothetical protein
MNSASFLIFCKFTLWWPNIRAETCREYRSYLIRKILCQLLRNRRYYYLQLTLFIIIVNKCFCLRPFTCSSTSPEKKNKQTPWSESASELYRPSDRRLSAKWLPTFVDKGCHVVSVTDPYGRILGFLDRSCSSLVLTRLSGPRSRSTTFFW